MAERLTPTRRNLATHIGGRLAPGPRRELRDDIIMCLHEHGIATTLIAEITGLNRRYVYELVAKLRGSEKGGTPCR